MPPEMPAQQTIALTGATGFIGSRLLEVVAAQGWSIRALTRRAPAPSAAQPSAGPVAQVTWVRGDMADRRALEQLVEGVQLVIHCAGRVRGCSAAAFHQVNADGTENLVRISRAQPQRPRLLLLSSLAARCPELSWYAASKYQAEQRLRQHGDALSWTILRPTAVYGPGDRELRGLFRAMRRGLLPVPGPAHARITLLHRDDLAQAVLCWARSEPRAHGLYEIHDGTPDGYSWPQLAAIAQTAWQRPVRRLAIPAPVLTSIAWINLGSAKLLGYDPMLTPGKVRELRHPDWHCDNGPIQAALGWQPRIRLLDSLQGDLAPLLKRP